MITPEVIPPAEAQLAALGLMTLAFAFSASVKREVKERQKGACHNCGTFTRKLQIHHRIPQSMGGEDTIENAVGLCVECHRNADQEALRAGVIYPQVYT